MRNPPCLSQITPLLQLTFTEFISEVKMIFFKSVICIVSTVCGLFQLAGSATSRPTSRATLEPTWTYDKGGQVNVVNVGKSAATTFLVCSPYGCDVQRPPSGGNGANGANQLGCSQSMGDGNPDETYASSGDGEACPASLSAFGLNDALCPFKSYYENNLGRWSTTGQAYFQSPNYIGVVGGIPDTSTGSINDDLESGAQLITDQMNAVCKLPLKVSQQKSRNGYFNDIYYMYKWTALCEADYDFVSLFGNSPEQIQENGLIKSIDSLYVTFDENGTPDFTPFTLVLNGNGEITAQEYIDDNGTLQDLTLVTSAYLQAEYNGRESSYRYPLTPERYLYRFSSDYIFPAFIKPADVQELIDAGVVKDPDHKIANVLAQWDGVCPLPSRPTVKVCLPCEFEPIPTGYPTSIPTGYPTIAPTDAPVSEPYVPPSGPITKPTTGGIPTPIAVPGGPVAAPTTGGAPTPSPKKTITTIISSGSYQVTNSTRTVMIRDDM